MASQIKKKKIIIIEKDFITHEIVIQNQDTSEGCRLEHATETTEDDVSGDTLTSHNDLHYSFQSLCAQVLMTYPPCRSDLSS